MGLEILAKHKLTAVEVMEVVMGETVVGVDHKIVPEVVVTAVVTVLILVMDITHPDMSGICLEEDEVEVNLIKVQM